MHPEGAIKSWKKGKKEIERKKREKDKDTVGLSHIHIYS